MILSVGSQRTSSMAVCLGQLVRQTRLTDPEVSPDLLQMLTRLTAPGSWRPVLRLGTGWPSWRPATGSPLSVRPWRSTSWHTSRSRGSVGRLGLLVAVLRGETTRWHRSACVPRVSVLLRRSWRLGGRREVAHQVGSDVAGLVATRGELADRPELPATAAQGSSDPCCMTCARRTTRGVVSRKGAPRTVFDPRVKCLVRAVNRWWGGWGSNPRPRDYE